MSSKNLNSVGIIFALFIGVATGWTLKENISEQPIQNHKIKALFSPNGQCTRYIIKSINAAKKEILMMAYGLTSPAIGDAIVNAHKKGVKVRILVDRQYENKPLVQTMIREGIEILIDRPPGIAHNKVIIIDRELLITGSFNFTVSAETRNAENLLFIFDKPTLEAYANNWHIRYQNSFKPQICTGAYLLETSQKKKRATPKKRLLVKTGIPASKIINVSAAA